MRLDYLKKKLTRLEERKNNLKAKGQASQDAAEVRSIMAQIEEVNTEIEDVTEEIASLETEERSIPKDAKLQNAGVAHVATFGKEERSEDYFESMEYRKAFREYVLNGTPITRSGEVISTEKTGAAIPMTVINDVINTVRKKYGNLYSKVKKISVAGGVEWPVGALSATFKWISESTVSPRQDLDKLAKVSFNYHTAEIRIAQSFLSQLLTLSSFESKITEIIAVAYLQAMDYGIINGSGNGTMTGILNDPRVTNTITMTAADMSNWQAWRKKFFSKLKLGYRAGEFIFPVGTVDTYLETMADSNGNPIFRQATGLEANDGDAADPNGRFFGHRISLVEDDIIANFDDASAGDVIGVWWQPQEYAINENFGFMMRRYWDDETNEWIDKALVVVDGKVLNPTGYYKIIKG